MSALKRFLDMTLLWADDDPSLPRYASRVLEGRVGRLITAADGEEAVDLFYEERPHMVLLDVEMPVLDGIGAAEAIRREDPEVAIVMVTGKNDRETMRKSIRSRIDDYLFKPVREEELLDVLERCARRRVPELPDEFRFANGAVYDTQVKALFREKQVVSLTKSEARLLELLIRKKGNVLLAQEIYWELWNGEPVSESAFKSLLSRLRAKVGKEELVNHPGIGYSLR